MTSERSIRQSFAIIQSFPIFRFEKPLWCKFINLISSTIEFFPISAPANFNKKTLRGGSRQKSNNLEYIIYNKNNRQFIEVYSCKDLYKR